MNFVVEIVAYIFCPEDETILFFETWANFHYTTMYDARQTADIFFYPFKTYWSRGAATV